MILVNKDIKSGESYNNCENTFLPRNLKDIPFYSNINTLIHSYDDNWTDEELLSYFDDDDNYKKYFIGDLSDVDTLYFRLTRLTFLFFRHFCNIV